MMLYMALLIFLLLVVLYQVYRMTEYFTASQTQTQILPSFSPTATTKVSEGLVFLSALTPIVNKLQTRVAALPDVVMDASLTEAEMTVFEFIKNPDPKNPELTVIQMPMTSNDTTPKYFDSTTAKDYVLKRLASDSNQLTDMQSTLTTAISENKISPDDDITMAGAKLYGNPQMVNAILGTFPQIYAKAQKIYEFYDKFAMRNTTATTQPTTTIDTTTQPTTANTDIDYTVSPTTIDYTTKPTDTTTKANSVHNLKMGSMWSAIGPIGSAATAKAHETTDQTRKVPDSTPSQVTEVSLSEETENRLVSSIMKQIKDQRLVDRSLDMPQDSSYSDGNPDCSSTSTEQGSEWKHAKPDMSKYIRKDSIPCWNCSP